MHRANTTLVGSGCTHVHKVGKVRSTLYDATSAAAPQSITNPCNYFGAHGPYTLWELASAKLLRTIAIGHPITWRHGNKCIGFDPHQWEQPTVARLDTLIMRHATIWQRPSRAPVSPRGVMPSKALILQTYNGFLGGRELTNIVVCANESEHNLRNCVPIDADWE